MPHALPTRKRSVTEAEKQRDLWEAQQEARLKRELVEAERAKLKAKEAESVETLSQYKEEIGWRERLQGDEEVLEEIRCESRHSAKKEIC